MLVYAASNKDSKAHAVTLYKFGLVTVAWHHIRLENDIDI